MSGIQTITRKDGTTYEYSGDTGIGHWQRREIKIVLRNPLDHSDFGNAKGLNMISVLAKKRNKNCFT